MKKLLLIFSMAAVTVGCEKKICGTADYRIINNIEVDIVVEVNFDDSQPMTILSGDTQMFHHAEWCRDANMIPSMTPEILSAEMTIDGEVVPRNIWRDEYWDIELTVGENHRTYTLTVTDELLETINANQ